MGWMDGECGGSQQQRLRTVLATFSKGAKRCAGPNPCPACFSECRARVRNCRARVCVCVCVICGPDPMSPKPKCLVALLQI